MIGAKHRLGPSDHWLGNDEKNNALRDAGWIEEKPGEWRKGVEQETANSFHFFETLMDEEGTHSSSKAFYNHLIEAALLHAQKQRDYGRDDDPFANVRASEEWNIPAWVGAMIRAQDKVRRLQTFAKKGTLSNEGVKDSLLDLAVYSLIALVLFEEDNAGTVK